jgi:hypothetical protein
VGNRRHAPSISGQQLVWHLSLLHRLEGVSPETRHQVMAGGAMGFYGLN